MRHSIFKIAFSMFAAVATLGFTACGSDDDYHPGALAPAGSVGAFFDKSNTSDFSFDEELPDSIVLKLNRLDSTETKTVKLTVECDTSAISIPDSVVFAKGKLQTDLVIKIDPGLYTFTGYDFTITIDPADVSPYAAGASSFSGSVFYGNPWTVIAEDAAFYFSTSSPLPTMYSDICQYKNDNHFRINNFMGSGTDLEFSLTGTFDGSDINTYAGQFAWNTDQVYHDDNGYDYIYATDENGDYAYGWTIDGCDVGINAFAAYMGAWSYIVFDKQDESENNRNYLYFYGFCDLDNGSAINAYFYGTWTPKK